MRATLRSKSVDRLSRSLGVPPVYPQEPCTILPLPPAPPGRPPSAANRQPPRPFIDFINEMSLTKSMKARNPYQELDDRVREILRFERFYAPRLRAAARYLEQFHEERVREALERMPRRQQERLVDAMRVILDVFGRDELANLLDCIREEGARTP